MQIKSALEQASDYLTAKAIEKMKKVLLKELKIKSCAICKTFYNHNKTDLQILEDMKYIY